MENQLSKWLNSRCRSARTSLHWRSTSKIPASKSPAEDLGAWQGCGDHLLLELSIPALPQHPGHVRCLCPYCHPLTGPLGMSHTFSQHRNPP